MAKRPFPSITEEEIQLFREPSFAKKTVYATNAAESAIFNYYLSLTVENNKSSFQKLTKSEMNDLLEKYYICSRTACGSEFKSTSLTTYRQNIARALKRTHGYDILNDEAFNLSNIVFINKMKHLKSIGKGAVDHHSDISESDLKKISTKLSPDNPTELQLLVWFNIQLYFCRRGMENSENMKKDHYKVKVVDGKKILVQNVDELSKNHREKDTERANGAVVEEQNHEKCPVVLFSKYMSKLQSSNPYLWQLPRKNYTSNEHWYERKAGIKTIQNFMKQISKICELSKVYTNHCVRSTTCTILGKSYSDISIQAISGHKSLSGLSHYKRVDDSEKLAMSQTLSTYLGSSISSAHEGSEEHNNCCLSYGFNSKATLSPDNDSLARISNVVDVDAPMDNGTSADAGNDSAIMEKSNVGVNANMNQWSLAPDDWNDVDIDRILSDECEKVENSVYRNVLFNNCSNCTFSNITINFPSNSK